VGTVASGREDPADRETGLCYLLDDPGELEDEVRDVAWRLFQVNEEVNL
jgi:hypothetical protein